ncbi:MAG: HAMP domain-containing protein [Acidobacteria bacterium]|nr:HAMP domain-containing protein [Acidobacteriota bacterium]
MKLKTRLFLTTAFAVLSILGFSEWLSHRQTAAFLRDHAALMEVEMDRADLVANLERGREGLFTRLGWLHVIHAGVTVLALVIVLGTLCDRIVLSPLDDLLRHINYMGRGTWKAAIPVPRKDEIGQLTQAFNGLGEQLTLTVQQFAAASKLSAMALLGQSVVKKVMAVRDLLCTTEQVLRVEGRQHPDVPEQALNSLAVAIKALDDIPVLFDEEFDRQFGLHSVPPKSRYELIPQDQACT